MNDELYHDLLNRIYEIENNNAEIKISMDAFKFETNYKIEESENDLRNFITDYINHEIKFMVDREIHNCIEDRINKILPHLFYIEQYKSYEYLNDLIG